MFFVFAKSKSKSDLCGLKNINSFSAPFPFSFPSQKTSKNQTQTNEKQKKRKGKRNTEQPEKYPPLSSFLFVISPPCPRVLNYWRTQQPFFLLFFSSMTTWLAEMGPGTTCLDTCPSEVTPLLLPPPPPPPPPLNSVALPAPASAVAEAWEFVPFCAVARFCESCGKKRDN